MDSSLAFSSRGPHISDAERNAVFYAPLNPFVYKQTAVPVHAFEEERRALLEDTRHTRAIILDLSESMELPYPATTPNMLARYAVIGQNDRLPLRVNAVVAIYCVLEGSGQSDCEGASITWSAGDVFLLPGGSDTVHTAGAVGAVLYAVTDEPMLSFAGTLAPGSKDAKLAPTYFPGSEININLAKTYARDSQGVEAAKSVWFVSQQMIGLRTTSPNITANLNTLPAGEVQRPHRHNAAAITLSIEGDGVHSMVDGQRSDWRRWGVMVTPPGVLHSHHNDGATGMRSFVVQDSGLHYYSRTTGFRFS